MRISQQRASIVCSVLPVIILMAGLVNCSDSDDALGITETKAPITERDMIVETTYVDRPAGRLTFLKIRTEDGDLRGLVLDESGNEYVDEDTQPDVIEELLRNVLRAVLPIELVEVTISLRDAVEDNGGTEVLGDARGSLVESFQDSIRVNGASVTLDGIQMMQEMREEHRATVQEARRSLRYARLQELAQRQAWDISETELQAFSSEFGSLVRVMQAQDVVRMAENNQDLIAAVGLYREGQDGSLTTAMAATSASPGALQLSNAQWAGIGVWLTESGCPPANFLSNYTRISGSDTDHSRNTTSILRAVSPAARIYCKGGAVLPNSTELMGSNGGPRVHIISRSNGVSGSLYDTLDRNWDDFTYSSNVLVVQAAGNGGNTTVVSGPGRGLNILTVGNYNDATMYINSSSSGGDPTNTRSPKPELSGPGTNINAGGFTMTGTSQSTPHIAGLLADVQQAYSWLVLNPELLKAHAIASATDWVPGGKPAAGEGGYDYLSGHWSFHNFWWQGSNGAFASWANSDPFPNNGAIDVLFNFTQGQVIVIVLSWLTRGTFTYDNRNKANPIGIDLDVELFGPNGAFVAGSYGWDSPYELLNLRITQTGQHIIRIRRPFNRDTSNLSRIGLSVNW